MAFSAFSGLAGASAASSKERKAKKEKKRLQQKLDRLEQERQDIINPYGDAENLSSIAFDLSNMIFPSYHCIMAYIIKQNRITRTIL